MRILPVNERAVLLELDDLPQTLSWLAALQHESIRGIEALVPAARTILIRFQPACLTRADLLARLATCRPNGVMPASGELIEIPVRYDGEDLVSVAEMLGITPEAVIARHTGACYTVAFTGFAPGFAYLTGGHPSLNVPRRQTPRTRIPAGSVGLAGRFSGVYPQASPGGWQLIGTTDVPMWDLGRNPPALLRPGCRVRFVEQRTVVAVARKASTGFQTLPLVSDAHRPALRVLATGLQALIQDLGRQGRTDFGIGQAGALDRAALRCANRLVGNGLDAAGLELIHGGFECESLGASVVAVCGADTPLWRVSRDGQCVAVQTHRPLALDDGDRLRLGAPRAGLRSYLAVRGGLDTPMVLGSRATDTLARIGPAPLVVGDVLPLATAPTRGGIVGDFELAPTGLPRSDDTVTLDVVLGPRADWFTDEALALLASQSWRVTPASNRIGVRLDGAQPLMRCRHEELPSEGTATGAIQVPASGQPVLFLADHPLTGGYPVIATVAEYHLDLAGQLPPGAWVRFRPLGPFVPLSLSF